MTASSQINIDLKNFLRSYPSYDLQTVDLGNSHPHQGIFVQGDLKEVTKVKSHEDINSLLKNNQVIASTVTTDLPFMQKQAEKLWHENHFCDVPVHYNSKQMGRDRLYQAAFLYHLYPQQDIVLIDAGTFLTVDFISPEGILGGYIFQGYKTYLRSYSHGKRLPDLSRVTSSSRKEQDNTSLLPSTTEQAITQSAHLYFENILSLISQKSVGKKVVITGGESPLIKNFLQANFEPHLIHYALYFLNAKLQEKKQ